LGLADLRPSHEPPEHGTTADLLAWAVMPPGVDDPVEGLISGVRIDLEALAEQHERCHPAFSDALVPLIRRLQVAGIFLKRADGRVPMVLDAPEATQDAAPAPEEKPS